MRALRKLSRQTRDMWNDALRKSKRSQIESENLYKNWILRLSQLPRREYIPQKLTNNPDKSSWSLILTSIVINSPSQQIKIRAAECWDPIIAQSYYMASRSDRTPQNQCINHVLRATRKLAWTSHLSHSSYHFITYISLSHYKLVL